MESVPSIPKITDPMMSNGGSRADSPALGYAQDGDATACIDCGAPTVHPIRRCFRCASRRILADMHKETLLDAAAVCIAYGWEETGERLREHAGAVAS
jgi:hypothetical protein